MTEKRVTKSSRVGGLETFLWCCCDMSFFIRNWQQSFIRQHLSQVTRNQPSINLFVYEFINLLGHLILYSPIWLLHSPIWLLESPIWCHLSFRLEVRECLDWCVVTLDVNRCFFLFLQGFVLQSFLLHQLIHVLLHLFELFFNNERINLHPTQFLLCQGRLTSHVYFSIGGRAPRA